MENAKPIGWMFLHVKKEKEGSSFQYTPTAPRKSAVGSTPPMGADH